LALHIACSTLCFASQPLDVALARIADLEFSKVELALIENRAHLNPSEVARDPNAALRKIRMGPSLTAAAMYLEIAGADPAEFRRQFEAVCKLAKLLTVTCITIPTAPVGSDVAAEVQRLRESCAHATAQGITLCVENHVGRLAQDPDGGIALCKAVPGLALTLDPSHYINGPHQNRDFSSVFPYVQHVHLRDTGTGPNQMQVQIGQGLVEYSRILAHLQRCRYQRTLSVEIIDEPGCEFDVETEVRKLTRLIDSLV
jgi:sugar phosphate isomerase/epimerase